MDGVVNLSCSYFGNVPAKGNSSGSGDSFKDGSVTCNLFIFKDNFSGDPSRRGAMFDKIGTTRHDIADTYTAKTRIGGRAGRRQQENG